MKALKIHNGKTKAEEAGMPSLWSEFFEGPFPSVFRDAQWMDRWFRPGAGFPTIPQFKAPVVDVSEDDKEIAVKAEIPGLTEKDIEVTFANGLLQIKGEKKGEKEEKRKNTWHRESWQGSFSRAIPLGDRVDWKKAQARHKDGVLTVTLPKKQGASENPVKINIQ